MTCELCGRDLFEVVDSPVIPWSGLGLFEPHYEQHQNDELDDVVLTVSEVPA